MATKTATKAKASSAVERYARAAKTAGVRRDQFERFLNAGAVLQPRQLAASAAARECDKEGGPTDVGYGGARGGGKSHWLLVQIAIDDCQREPGLKCLILRKVGKALTEGFEDLRLRILANIPHSFQGTAKVLSFPNGSRIVLGHYQHEKDVDAYLGLEYDVIGIEEATTLTQKKVEMISTCCRTSKANWRPRMYYTTNPGGIGHGWFRRKFVSKPDKKTRFIPATVRDNSFVNKEYKAKLEQLTGWQRDAWLDGSWDIAAGQFFTTFREAIHVIKPPEGFTPVKVWGGFDYGFTHHTAFYLFGKDGDGNVYVMGEHVQNRWLPQRHAPAIHALLDRHGLTVKDLKCIVAGADCFMKGKDKDGLSIAEQYAELGIPLTPANTDRINGASEILQRFGDDDPDHPVPARMFIYNTCVRLIECLPSLVHDPHRPEDVLKVDADEDGNGGDDPYDGFRYGVMDDYVKPSLQVSNEAYKAFWS
jgi:hypothetical protein